MWRDALNYWPMPSICIGRETTHFSQRSGCFESEMVLEHYALPKKNQRQILALINRFKT